MTQSEFKFKFKIAVANYRHTMGFDPLGVLIKYETYVNIKDILVKTNDINFRPQHTFKYEGIPVSTSVFKLTGDTFIEHRESYIFLESNYTLTSQIIRNLL